MNSTPSDSTDKSAAAPTAPIVSDTTLEILRAHQGMMWTAVAKFGVDFLIGAVLHESPIFVLIPFLCAFVVIELAIAYFVFRLGNAIYGVGPGVVCGTLSVCPCLGVFLVLILNGTTTDLVRKSGVKIGFMGITKPQLEALIAAKKAAAAAPPVA